MKKNLFSMKGGKLVLAICCLVLAVVFWVLVKYLQAGGLASLAMNFG